MYILKFYKICKKITAIIIKDVFLLDIFHFSIQCQIIVFVFIIGAYFMWIESAGNGYNKRTNAVGH